MKKILLFIFSIGLITLARTQDLARVRAYIDTLTSPGMHGRGYVNNGEKIAASFLEEQFKNIGLEFFDHPESQKHPYFQYFRLNVNTFPGKVFLKTKSDTLTLGKDYILSPSSGGGNRCLPVKFIDTLIFNNQKAQNKFAKINTQKIALAYPANFSSRIQKLPENLQKKISKSGALIKIQDKKLTASISNHELPMPEFEVMKGCLQKTKIVCFNVDAVLKENYETQNIIGFVKGTKYIDSFIVISAHYDHLGQMGSIYFPGANDNASGVSLLLELAKYYKEHPAEYSIAFIAFGAEEAGLIGSAYYTNHPLFDLKEIKFLINLDLLGTGDDGIMVVNATKFPEEFKLLSEINEKEKYLPAVKSRGPAANSDHYFFTLKGVPAFFVYTLGGITAYHDIYDKKETLPLTKFEEVFKLLTDFIKKFN